MTDNIKTLYTFTVLSDRLVDEVTERTETIEGVERTTTETTKVNKPVPTYFAFKKPSRTEREAALEEYAVAWGKYFDMGVLPEAVLLKKYANAGGILSEDQKREYTTDRVSYATKSQDLIIANAIKETPKEDIERLTGELIDLRDKIMRFEQDQSSFFENTAEAKAKVKLSEYLVIKLSYWRAAEDQPWVPYFKTASDLDRLEDGEDKILSEAYPQLLFLAQFLEARGYNSSTADVDEFLKSRN